MRPITDRMDEALHKLAAHWSSRRKPKAFYLGPDDWDEFRVLYRESVRVPFGNNPTQWRDEIAYKAVPVRQSKNVPPRQSRLYDHTGAGRLLPE